MVLEGCFHAKTFVMLLGPRIGPIFELIYMINSAQFIRNSMHASKTLSKEKERRSGKMQK